MGSEEASRYDEEEMVTIVKNDKGQVVAEIHGDLNEHAKLIAKFFLNLPLSKR